MHNHSSRSAFTLIELLVVIAIIAVLAVVVVLTLNPAQLLAQARDANRVSDMATLNSAINLYNVDQAGTSGFSLGTSSITYLSIPDLTATTTAGTNCVNLGTNFSSSTVFDCPASSTYRLVNGQGWIPINFSSISAGSPFGSLPVDPVNNTSTNEYYSYQPNAAGTYRIVAVPESQKYAAQVGTNPTMFMTGSNANLYGAWVLVPGNPNFGTGNFYVMKYDAICSDGKGNPLNDYDAGSSVYGNVFMPCTAVNSRTIASLPGGWPIGQITWALAISYCQGIGAHLMTNAEWQTAAWNIENQAINWSGGSVGSGYVYVGHNNGGPLRASPASPSDNMGYYGTNGPYTGGGTGALGSNINQLRTLTLSNGGVVWDLSGNIMQFLSDTIVTSNEPHGVAAGGNYIEFTAVTSWGSTTQQAIGPANASWNSTQGMGLLYSFNGVDPTVYGYVRGNAWNSGANFYGIESLYIGLGLNFTFSNVGFRCAR